MKRSLLLARTVSAGLIISLAFLTGCPSPNGDDAANTQGPGNINIELSGSVPAPPAPAPTAKAEDVDAAKTLLDGLGAGTSYKLVPDGLLREIVIQDGSKLAAEDIALFGRLTDLETLQILNCRELNDEMVANLAGLKKLKTLGLTNSVIGDAAVEMIAKSFPELTNLDLSSNTNMTNGVLKVISEMSQLERLTLVQNRFNDLGTGRLAKLEKLRVLDLRGNMEAGDMTMEIIGVLPALVAFKHRSTTVSDFGIENLANSKTLRALLMQDFGITSMAGEQLAKLENLSELEIFRCQGFGSDGVLALKGMKLSRLQLRDLPMVDDMAMEVFTDLPELKKLYIHENDSVSDYGLENIKNLTTLEVLDIWSVPQMTDATIDIIAGLPNLQELSIRETDITDAAIDKLLAMPKLKSLTLKDNGNVSAEGLEKLSVKEFSKLDIGQ